MGDIFKITRPASTLAEFSITVCVLIHGNDYTSFEKACDYMTRHAWVQDGGGCFPHEYKGQKFGSTQKFKKNFTDIAQLTLELQDVESVCCDYYVYNTADGYRHTVCKLEAMNLEEV